MPKYVDKVDDPLRPPAVLQTFSRATPITYVTITNTETGASEPAVPMVLDTGADVTILPFQTALDAGIELGAAPRQVEGIGGMKRDLYEVYVRLGFNGIEVPLWVMVDRPGVGILGRDVLDYHRLLFDGPNRTWSAE